MKSITRQPFIVNLETGKPVREATLKECREFLNGQTFQVNHDGRTIKCKLTMLQFKDELTKERKKFLELIIEQNDDVLRRLA